jgi:NitT/TauT family transport system substrate-binding protein
VNISKMAYKRRPRPQKHLIIPWILLVLAAGSVAFPLRAGETPLKKASLIPLWTPQAQFAGFYVALDKGFYIRHGVDLNILKSGPGCSPIRLLEEGRADFAVVWLTTALLHRDAGKNLVNLAQLNQRSSLMLISKKAAGIRTLTDMKGKKVGLWEGDVAIPLRMLFARHRIKVREVRQSYTINLFLRGGIDVTSAMWFNEYHTIINAGLDPQELNTFFLSDQDMNFLEDGIYTLEKTLRQDPALAEAFVAASLEGWRYAFEHPDEALDIVIKYMREARLPANRMHQQWMLGRMKDLMMPTAPETALGQLREQDYEAVARTLQKDGLIRSYPDFAAFSWRPDAGKE